MSNESIKSGTSAKKSITIPPNTKACLKDNLVNQIKAIEECIPEIRGKLSINNILIPILYQNFVSDRRNNDDKQKVLKLFPHQKAEHNDIHSLLCIKNNTILQEEFALSFDAQEVARHVESIKSFFSSAQQDILEKLKDFKLVKWNSYQSPESIQERENFYDQNFLTYCITDAVHNQEYKQLFSSLYHFRYNRIEQSTKVVKKYFQFLDNEQDIKNIINDILQHPSVANNYILFQSIESVICRSDAYIKLLNQNVLDDKNLQDQIITNLVCTLGEIESDEVNELVKSLQDKELQNKVYCQLFSSIDADATKNIIDDLSEKDIIDDLSEKDINKCWELFESSPDEAIHQNIGYILLSVELPSNPLEEMLKILWGSLLIVGSGIYGVTNLAIILTAPILAPVIVTSLIGIYLLTDGSYNLSKINNLRDIQKNIVKDLNKFALESKNKLILDQKHDETITIKDKFASDTTDKEKPDQLNQVQIMLTGANDDHIKNNGCDN